jgi:hypothetical protein
MRAARNAPRDEAQGVLTLPDARARISQRSRTKPRLLPLLSVFFVAMCCAFLLIGAQYLNITRSRCETGFS